MPPFYISNINFLGVLVKILVLTKYGRLGASSRVRFIQYFSYLKKYGFQLDHHELVSDQMLRRRYELGKYEGWKIFKGFWERFFLLYRFKKCYSLIWIEGEVFPFFPAIFELLLLKDCKYVVDYDDAIFHRYDMNRFWLVRFFLGKRIDKIMKWSDLVVVGNNYIGGRAVGAGASKVELIPTVVDLKRYKRRKTPSILPVVGWIGSPTTSIYLASIQRALVRLHAVLPFELWVIGGEYANKELNVKSIPWSEDTEVELIQKFDVGIMPLFDTPWEHGKCGYKIVQYMACGKPVVASPIGVNCEMVSQCESGFLAATEDDWFNSLFKLLSDKELAAMHGSNGSKAVAEKYSLQVTAERVMKVINSVQIKPRR